MITWANRVSALEPPREAFFVRQQTSPALSLEVPRDQLPPVIHI
jgi:hypothetical protein